MTTRRILIIGCDKGSWQMRGRQLGAAIGARVTSKPKAEDWAWAEVIVLVKRAMFPWWREAKAARAPVVWDVLDLWHQPSGNQRTEADLVREIGELKRAVGVAQVIGATEAMARVIGGVYLPHHSRAGLVPTPCREQLRTVAYDGSERYLGGWRVAIEAACRRMGLRFVINPHDLSHVDLFVAFRGEQWDGWVCRQWKSGVKYVNALAAGRPILTQASAAFGEIQPAGAVVEQPEDVEAAIAAFAPVAARDQAYRESRRRASAYLLERVAQRYVSILEGALAATR